MAYDYRKMSLEEREELVRVRKANGYPLHSPPHLIREQGYYLITAACYEHAAIMSLSKRRSEFESRILSSLQTSDIQISAWVILPNHYHILIGVTDFEKIPVFIKKLHNGTSYEWNREDNCSGKRKVWFHYLDRFIRDEPQYFQAINYIHFNPVKHAYVEDPFHWHWSSLNLYYENNGRDWLRQTWINFPPQKLNIGELDG